MHIRRKVVDDGFRIGCVRIVTVRFIVCKVGTRSIYYSNVLGYRLAVVDGTSINNIQINLAQTTKRIVSTTSTLHTTKEERL